MKIKFTKLRDNATVPVYQSAAAVGADLYAAIDSPVIIEAGACALIPTGIAVSPESDSVALLIFARSGLATKFGISLANGVGVVDPDYRGEVKVALKNTSGAAYTVNSGDRIAQLAAVPFIRAEFEEVRELDETERGAGGFGSTGRG